MELADVLRDKGNTAFMAGDAAAAQAHYLRAIELLEASAVDSARETPAFRELRRNLYSNLSNAYLSLGQHVDACAAAQLALAIDPSFVKASLRYVRGKMLAGHPFEAFVYALRHTRPIVREMLDDNHNCNSSATKEAAKALREVESQLCTKLGIARLSDGVELVDYEGGVDMISRRAYKAGDILFVEEKYDTTFDEGSVTTSPDAPSGLTTEGIVLRFAQRIRPAQAACTKEWQTFTKDFAGAWPRSKDDVDAFTRKHVGDYIRPHFRDLDEDTFNELLLISLMCRYNCFYTGFFRTCALANHSCAANIAMKYNPAAHTVTMVAVMDIQPGERMNVKYLSDAYFLLGLCKRRELLRAWLFWCRCPRCREDGEASTAIQEYVRCAECGRYTHYPIPAPPRPDAEVDPIVPASPTCAHCGSAGVAWPEDKLQRFYQLPDGPLSDASVPEVGRWLVGKLLAARALGVHPAHWIHRVLYYLFCLSLNPVLQRCFASVNQARTTAARHEAAREVFARFGLHQAYAHVLEALSQDPHAFDGGSGTVITASSSSSAPPRTYDPAGVAADTVLVRTAGPTHGCDVLRALCTLCHLIEPFYPNAEMWAVHKMICECVMMQLLFQAALGLPESDRIHQEQALTLLQAHGALLGEQAASRWLHSFSLLKSSVAKEDERDLPTVVTLKRVFKLK